MDRVERIDEKRLKARYGYLYPEKDRLNAVDVYTARVREQALIEYILGSHDEKTAKAKINQWIPTITDDEIDEYLGISD